MKKLIIALIMTNFITIGFANAKTIKGLVRTVNHESLSLGLDQPPLIRVYANSATQYSGEAQSFQQIQPGDQLEIKGRAQNQGTFVATQIKVTAKGQSDVSNLNKKNLEVALDQRFLMKVGQTALLKENGKTTLKIYAESFINTLCQGGRNCTGEGDIGMAFKVHEGKKENSFLLVSQGHRKPLHPVKRKVQGYELQLIEAGEEVVLLVVRK